MPSAPQVGCHLIVFRGQQDEDLDAVLRAVRDAGYDGVEARTLAGGDPQAARARLQEYGLRQGSMSTGYAMLDELDASLEYANGVGARFLMVSGVGDHQTEGLGAFERAAERFNEVGRRCQAAGCSSATTTTPGSSPATCPGHAPPKRCRTARRGA